MSIQSKVSLPDLLNICPWAYLKNPHYEIAGPASAAWVNSFGFFVGEKLQKFNESYNELLVAYTFPYAEYEEFRTLCDFSNVLFVIDEITDEQSGQDAVRTGTAFLRAMNHKASVGSTLAIERFVSEFRDRLDHTIYPGNLRRFISVFSSYLKEVGHEAEAREQEKILTLDKFILARRENSAVRAFFSLIEFAIGVDIPEAVYEDHMFLTCYWAAVDMVCYANDLYSYRVERSSGLEGNNLLTILMHSNDYTLQEAADETGKRFQSLVDSYVSAKSNMPSFLKAPGGYIGVDEDVQKLLHGMEQWVVGNIKWSFDSMRYFGSEHNEVEKTLVVCLEGSKYAS